MVVVNCGIKIMHEYFVNEIWIYELEIKQLGT